MAELSSGNNDEMAQKRPRCGGYSTSQNKFADLCSPWYQNIYKTSQNTLVSAYAKRHPLEHNFYSKI